LLALPTSTISQVQVQEEEEKKAEFDDLEGDIKVESFLIKEDADFE
jgi:hypothetical protein